jgi:hypothetical protein
MKKYAVIITIFTLVTLASSCTPNGYGCNGRGKIITRVR